MFDEYLKDMRSEEEQIDCAVKQITKEEEKRKRKHTAVTISKKALAGIVTGSVVFSSVFGLAGGAIASNRINNANATAQNEQTESAVSNVSWLSNDSKEDMSVIDVAAIAADSIVEITTEIVGTSSRMQQYISEGAGSGVIISNKGEIVTNHHVIDGASKITVRLKDGTSYDAKVIGSDVKTDIAVIKIEANNLQPVVFGDSDTLKVGELAVAIGNPLGQLGGTVTEGIISALDRQITIDGETMTLLQTSAAINPGNSGGGLFNEAGELIGVVNAKSSGSDIEGLGFAVPVNTVKTVVDDILQYGYVQGRVELGVSLIDIANAQTAMMYRVQNAGVYVYSGSDNSKELQGGDQITSIDGKAVSSIAEIKSILDQHHIGDQLEIEVIRTGEKQTIKTKLKESKPSNVL